MYCMLGHQLTRVFLFIFFNFFFARDAWLYMHACMHVCTRGSLGVRALAYEISYLYFYIYCLGPAGKAFE
jgi:hypothetical protein